MSPLRRLISPNTNATGLVSVLALALAVAFVVLNHQWHPHGNPIDLKTLTALGASVSALLTRFTTTPIVDPKNGAGERLMTTWQHSAEALSASLEGGGFKYKVLPAGVEPAQRLPIVPADEPDHWAMVQAAAETRPADGEPAPEDPLA
jgi:hypothetical protein